MRALRMSFMSAGAGRRRSSGCRARAAPTPSGPGTSRRRRPSAIRPATYGKSRVVVEPLRLDAGGLERRRDLRVAVGGPGVGVIHDEAARRAELARARRGRRRRRRSPRRPRPAGCRPPRTASRPDHAVRDRVQRDAAGEAELRARPCGPWSCRTTVQVDLLEHALERGGDVLVRASSARPRARAAARAASTSRSEKSRPIVGVPASQVMSTPSRVMDEVVEVELEQVAVRARRASRIAVACASGSP